MNGASVTDQRTGQVLTGTVDLEPTFERIASGRGGLSRNDGSVFQNRDGTLPTQVPGYYREYVIPTAGTQGPGAQRLVVGQGGEAYYTSDHYANFSQVRGYR